MGRIRARILCAVAALAVAGCAPAAAEPGAAEGPSATERPALVLLVVVDQLRADLLTRYHDLFTGGLRRLLDEGRVFPNATHDHLTTETAPGHATLATGTHPSRHGVVSNHWYVRREAQWIGVENVLDTEHPVLGAERYVGASPEVVLRDGLADWMRAADAASRSVAVSGKPRGAVLLGGRSRDTDVYWFEPAVGRFVTSTWYRDRVPEWVASFNDRVLPTFAEDSVWESSVPAAAAPRSRADTASFEADGIHTYFPHTFEKAQRRYPEIDFWTWFTVTPFLDAATLELARAAVEARELGADDTPDLLSLSLSQTDLVGHDFGPLSREQLDNLLRLDAALGQFFRFLDERVGRGRWIVGFSSDHGAQDAPEAEVERGVEAVRLNGDSLATLQRVVNEVVARVGSADPSEFGPPLAERMEQLPWIARAWSHGELERGEPADSFETLARNSHHPGRPSGLLGRLGVEYMVAPHVLPFGYDEAGSTHQSGYYHDRHVPFVLLGAEVAAGTDTTRVSTTDLAPTLAAVMGLEPPGDLDGVARAVGGGGEVPSDLRRSSSRAPPGT